MLVISSGDLSVVAQSLNFHYAAKSLTLTLTLTATNAFWKTCLIG